MSNTEKRNAVIYINGVEVNNTMDSIEKHARSLRNEMRFLTRGTEEYNAKVKELQATNKIIAQHKNQVSGVNKVWQDVKSQIAGTGAVLMAFLGGQALFNGFKNMIQRLSAIDDQLTDIGKTTGLNRRELQALDKDLRTISTRSTRTELLDLAKEAGKLGYNSVADIKRFVEQADQINVALGEDLGEGAITEIGKLANVFKTEMLNIGSALNDVAAEGIASEGWQVDYLNRLSGIAGTAKLSLPDLLGYGAALESMGQSSEVSGTSLSQFFLKFIADTEKFGEMAGFAKGELSALVNDQGTNAAFVEFLERLKSSSTGTADLINKLDELGIDGSRASNILLTLANNTAEVSRQQLIANESFEKGTSITDEFTKKQENFAASYARLQKWIASIFLNNALADGVRNMVTWFSELVSPVKTVNQQLEEERLNLNTLVLSLTNHNTSQATRLQAIDQLKKSYPEFIKLVDIETASNEELFSALNKVNQEYAKQIVIQRKGEQAADQAEKQADALQKVIDLEMRYSKAAAKIKDITGMVQGATEKNVDFIQRVGFVAWDQSAKGVTKEMLALRDAHKELNIVYTDLPIAQKYLNIETEKFNTLLGEQQTLQAALLGNDSMNGPMPMDPGALNPDGTTPNGNLNDFNEKLKETKKLVDEIANKEEVRQQIFLALADEETKGIAEIDAFWEELINLARTYGLETDELEQKWREASDEYWKKTEEAKRLANAMFKGDGGGEIADVKGADAAALRREQLEEEIELTVKLREERERYVESMYMAGAAAVESAENEQEAIRGVLNAIRDAIRQRIMEAIAAVVSKALLTVPFPFNLIVGAAAGAGAQALFDKLVPQAADGGYSMDVIGAQTGRGYRAAVNQKFMGGYVSQPMLVGEHGAEYTVPNYLMQNPYALRMVDELEGLRKGGSASGKETTHIDFSELIAKMNEIKKLMEDGKTNVVVMPDQTITEFNKRLRMLEILSLIPFR